MPKKREQDSTPPPELWLPPAERIEVDPHDVRHSPLLPRDYIDGPAQARLERSIELSGFVGAARGMRRKDGTIVLTHGLRMLLAAKKLGVPLPIDVRPEGPLVEVLDALLEHGHRQPYLPHEEGLLYREALKAMQQALGFPVTQAQLAEWTGIDPATISMCLTIVRRITVADAKRAGIDFAAAKRQPRRTLYEIAKIEDDDERGAHLAHLVTGQWPAGYSPLHRGTEDGRAFKMIRRGFSRSIKIFDTRTITDADLDEMLAVVREDVETDRAALETRSSA